ncbi:MAG: hypothetical protein WA117_25420 [Verrucomicrobiia bacterium]
MKHLLFLILFFAAVTASAVEVDVTLKNGKKVTGAVLVDNNEKLVILVQASNGVYRMTINKGDIAEVKDSAAAKNIAFGPKDKERLDMLIKATENEVIHREKIAAKSQETLENFIRSRNRLKESATQRTALDRREAEVRTRANAARMQSETVRLKLNAFYKEREAMNKKIAEAQRQAK